MNDKRKKRKKEVASPESLLLKLLDLELSPKLPVKGPVGSSAEGHLELFSGIVGLDVPVRCFHPHQPQESEGESREHRV